MMEQEDTRKKSRRDLLWVLLILPFGVLCMFLAGQTAIKLAPEWSMNADMRSLLDPNATFAAQGIPALIEPINPGILTRPAWGSLFLTPNAPIPTRPIPSPTSSPVSTLPPPPVPTSQQEEPTATATIPVPIILPTSGGPGKADLRIEKSDNSSTYTPGTSINYTIYVTNLGPDSVPRFNIVDDIPTVISGLSVNCKPADRCGSNTSSGNRISFTGAALPNGGVITISVSGTVASSATGALVNTATVTIPSGVRVDDPNSANNTVTDRDTQRSVYDVAISKSDGSDTYTATAPINYTITVTNSGPSDAIGITVRDEKPPQITSWGWCIAPCTPNPNATNGNLSNIVNIPSGGNIQYSVSAIPSGVPENIRNTARLIIPSGPGTIVEQNSSNNTATDTDIPYIDLQITKDDFATVYTPGSTVTYTVTVTNNSTFSLTGVTVADTIPTLIDPLTWYWTCAPASGSIGASCTPGPNNTSINDTAVNLPPNASVVYSITGTVLSTATSDLINTASVSPSAGLVDAVPANNTATDTNTFSVSVDLSITKTDGTATYTRGGPVSYTVTVTNNSAIAVNGVIVTDNIPALIDPATWYWSCGIPPSSPGTACSVSSGTGNINLLVNLPAGGSVYLQAGGTVRGSATGTLTNEARVDPPSGFVDIDANNNTATDTDVSAVSEPDIGPPDGGIVSPLAGSTTTYFISPAISSDGTSTPDFVFYEYYRSDIPGIAMDRVAIQLSQDGNLWTQVFNWGDEILDLNSKVHLAVNALCGDSERDGCVITASPTYLYQSNGYYSGIEIDIDSLGLSGSYPWIRFYCPLASEGNNDGSCDIDAIQPYYP